jgi:hypothetical protein
MDQSRPQFLHRFDDPPAKRARIYRAGGRTQCGAWPTVEDELPLDYHERIRLIADVCENLPGYLRADTPVQGLKYAWKQANEMQQAWLRDTLAQHGVAITDLAGN